MHQPFGTWRSPLPAAVVAAQGLRLSSVAIDGDDVYWIEGRAADGGRNVIVRLTGDGRTSDVVPPGFNARSRVHEYGGTAYAVAEGTVQRVVRTSASGVRRERDHRAGHARRLRGDIVVSDGSGDVPAVRRRIPGHPAPVLDGTLESSLLADTA